MKKRDENGHVIEITLFGLTIAQFLLDYYAAYFMLNFLNRDEGPSISLHYGNTPILLNDATITRTLLT